ARPQPLAGAVDGDLVSLVNRKDVVAVDLHTRHSVREPFLRECLRPGLLAARHGDRPAVVHAGEYAWESIGRRKVQPLVKISRAGRAVTEKAQGDAFLFS